MNIQAMLNNSALDNVRDAVTNYRRLASAHPEWVARMNDYAVQRFNNTRTPFDFMDEKQKQNFKYQFSSWVHDQVIGLAGDFDGYVVTNGLMVSINEKSPRLLKVCFEKYADDVVIAYVESAQNGSRLPRFGYYYMTRDALRDMPEDPYDGMVFNRAAFQLFGLSV